MWSVDMLPLEKKVGQLFMLGFSGPIISSDLTEWISERGLGGVILFRRNIEGPKQVATLISHLQELAHHTEAAIPLCIAIDQEGGRVRRLPPPFTQFQAPAVWGTAPSPELVYTAAQVMATELHAVGITMNLAPVLDVHTNPANPVIGSRAFSSDPALVSQLGVAFIKGLQDSGIIATGKHFPGHGDTSLDSHLVLPIVAHPWERLRHVELLPFVDAIQAGVGALMTAHVFYPTLDPRYPATLSRSILEELLRTKLGFHGVIITDDLVMQAVTADYSTGEAAVRACQAGADILLISQGVDQQQEAYQAILKALQQGDIREDRLERSVERILRLKRRFPLSLPLGRIEDILQQEVHQARVAKIMRYTGKGI